jgi:hypothetical protein
MCRVAQSLRILGFLIRELTDGSSRFEESAQFCPIIFLLWRNRVRVARFEGHNWLLNQNMNAWEEGEGLQPLIIDEIGSDICQRTVNGPTFPPSRGPQPRVQFNDSHLQRHLDFKNI